MTSVSADWAIHFSCFVDFCDLVIFISEQLADFLFFSCLKLDRRIFFILEWGFTQKTRRSWQMRLHGIDISNSHVFLSYNGLSPLINHIFLVVSVRYQFFLQVRQDVRRGRLACPAHLKPRLSALMMLCKKNILLIIMTSDHLGFTSRYFDSSWARRAQRCWEEPGGPTSSDQVSDKTPKKKVRKSRNDDLVIELEMRVTVSLSVQQGLSPSSSGSLPVALQFAADVRSLLVYTLCEIINHLFALWCYYVWWNVTFEPSGIMGCWNRTLTDFV